ncbi:MAG: MBL fold metallo-hydrolase [Candidatus Staskawiczbacteria bacterium]|nr:MBL fold metallo-hydrolase [Candidatus Staskawiczbacteria bacterium]
MLAEVKVLVLGVSNAESVIENGEEHTQPTITLVRDKDFVMVVDPGVLENQQVLVEALKKENLTVQDVNVVCITHSHLDHYRNIGMFPNAKAIDYYGVWDKTTIVTWSEDLTDNIKVLHTPGHDYTSITLFVTTKDGVVAICGDVFWRENYPRDPHDDVFASNPERLKESREMILRDADWIVPGHGPMYKNDRAAEEEKEREQMAEKRNEEGIRNQKVTIACKRCGMQMSQKDKCRCRPYLCFRCCECGLDCNNCSCSHRKS